MAQQEFTEEDDTNFDVPPGVTEITIEVWQPGAGGADFTESGRGGGGGGYGKRIATVDDADVLIVNPGVKGGALESPTLGYVLNDTQEIELYFGTSHDTVPTAGDNGGFGGTVFGALTGPQQVGLSVQSLTSGGTGHTSGGGGGGANESGDGENATNQFGGAEGGGDGGYGAPGGDKNQNGNDYGGGGGGGGNGSGGAVGKEGGAGIIILSWDEPSSGSSLAARLAAEPNIRRRKN